MTDKLILRTSDRSPYGRKTRMTMLIHELNDKIDVVGADTLDETDSLREQNPLGKIPCLVLPNGNTIYDSRIIAEYFDSLSSKPPLVPMESPERFDVLTRTVLCDGITDAALLMVYERRFREPEQVSERWLSHQSGKIFRGLDAVKAAPPPIDKIDLSSVALACALAYLDWRQPVTWRNEYPELVSWLERFSDQEASFAQTAAA
jgi:glutathione S-transferase